jgi:hypothetical protein
MYRVTGNKNEGWNKLNVFSSKHERNTKKKNEIIKF